MKEGEYDFDCTFSLDGHIYRTEEIWPHIERVGFSTPNELEDRLWPVRFQLQYAEHSCLVGIPHNRVQDQYPNKNAGGSAKKLNARFLAGDRIDLEAMDFSNVIGVHQEIPYRFKKAGL